MNARATRVGESLPATIRKPHTSFGVPNRRPRIRQNSRSVRSRMRPPSLADALRESERPVGIVLLLQPRQPLVIGAVVRGLPMGELVVGVVYVRAAGSRAVEPRVEGTGPIERGRRVLRVGPDADDR